MVHRLYKIRNQLILLQNKESIVVDKALFNTFIFPRGQMLLAWKHLYHFLISDVIPDKTAELR